MRRLLPLLVVLAAAAAPAAAHATVMLKVADLRSGVVTTLASGTDTARTPDGTALVVAYVYADSAHLAGVTPGGRPVTVADLGHMDVVGLTVSPDGTRAAFTGSDSFDFWSPSN
jgi:hypothetical protein